MESENFSDQTLFYNCLLGVYSFAAVTAFSLLLLQPPYGKFRRSGWGPMISSPVAWFVMESPTIWLTLLVFSYGRHRSNPRAISVMSVYLFHYFNRTFIYPLLLRSETDRGFPVSLAAIAFSFNVVNAYLQTRWVSHYESDYNGSWFWWRFGVGLTVFASGMWLNIWSDRVLVGLKRDGDGYKVPRGGLFELVSCPNYLGELTEWLGWAIMTWSYVGFGFFLYTCAYLIPRARGNHEWYMEKLKDEYPKSRKAVIPFVY